MVFASISFLAAAASAQTVEDFTSQTPAVGEQFGGAVASGDIINGPSGTQHWVIAGVPYARSGLASAAGQVEFFPTINSPTAPPFTISAPIGHIQASAHFGWSVATADFDGDGTMDVVVGAPDQDVGSVIDQGRAFVFFGPWSPLSTPPYSNWAYLDVGSSEVSIAGEPGGQFGYSVAAGLLNTLNNYPDIVVGIPHATYVPPPPLTREPDVGGVDIFLDVTATGGFTPTYRYNHLYDPDITRATGNRYGAAVGIGQFGQSFLCNLPEPVGLGDVVVGPTGYDEAAYGTDSGRIWLHFGHGTATTPVWNNDPDRKQGHPSPNTGTGPSNQFGSSISVYDIDGDGWHDFLVGAPGSPGLSSGFAVLFRGGQCGITNYAWHDNYSTGDLYGTSVLWADIQGDSKPEALIGAPGGPSYAGGLVEGLAGDFTIPYFSAWTQVAIYTDPTPNGAERFGYRLAAALRFGTVKLDVVIGAPNANIPGYTNAGEAFVFNN